MPSAATPPISIFDVGAADKKGMLQTVGASALVQPEVFISLSGADRALRFVKGTGQSSAPYADFDLTGATVTLSIGPAADLAPTAGQSSGTYPTAGPTAIGPVAAGASAATMATALNANAGITANGGVTVTAVTGGYRIEWNSNGPRDLISWSPGSLTPPARTPVQRLITGVAGGGGKHEVQFLKIVQDYWGATNVWSQEAIGSIVVTPITVGADGVRAVTRINITGNPKSGQWKISAPQKQKFAIYCSDNAGASFSSIVLTGFTGRTIAGMNSTAIDLYDDAGPARFWYNVNSTGTAPPTPTGGRIVVIALAASLPAAYATEADYIYALTRNAIEADSKFNTVSIATLEFKIINAVLGQRTISADVNSGLQFNTFYAGSAGKLDQKSFRLFDSSGSVDLYFNLSNATVLPVTLIADRYIEITAIGGTTAGHVATAVQAALDADAEFVATVLTNVVTVEQAVGGARETPTAIPGQSNFGVKMLQIGYNIGGTLPFNASGAQVKTALGSRYNVVVSPGDSFEWLCTAVEAGVQAPIVATNVSLGWVQLWVGQFTLNTETMLAAFLNTAEDSLIGKMEVQYQYPGEDAVKFYQAPITVYRALIDTASLNPLNPLNPTNGEWREGSVAIVIADLVDDRAIEITFPIPYADANWMLLSHTISNSVDAPPDAILPATYYSPTMTGFRVLLSAPPPNGNYVYNYFTRHNP